MISLLPYDAGTRPMFPVSTVPGCDEVYYRHVRMEEAQFEDRRAEINAGLREVVPFTMQPWPDLMPGKMWVDLCREYAFESDGMPCNLYHWDTATSEGVIVPAGTAHLDEAPDEILDPHEGRTTRQESIEEVQEWAGPGWFRLETWNESRGTRLRHPARIVFDNLRGPAYRLEVPDNTLWAPFDLRLGLDAYTGVYDDGTNCPDDVTAGMFNLTQRGRYALYLVPRRWRTVATVLVHFLYVTCLESFPNDEIFIKTSYDRPPVYPFRHDVLHSVQDTPLHDFYGNPRSYDPGIDYGWSNSRVAADLGTEILAQQFFSPCLAYIYIGHENPSLAVWAHPPRQGQIVCGLGRLDAGGDETRIWFRQVADLSSEYPIELVGEFLATQWQIEI